MVKVTVVYKGKGLESLEIKGHANSAPYPHDLVCAAVSAIAVGGMNAIEGEDHEIEVDEGLVTFTANGPISEHDQTVLETIIVMLKTIEVSYRGTVVIKERK